MKTPKGTELPFLNMRGKDYLEVKYRLVWFREEHPDWGIHTQIVSFEPDSALMRAQILNERGQVIAEASKQEAQKDFPDFLEKAETGAIGRALALCGYGTQFAPELEEGERIVDSPVNRKPAPLKAVPSGDPGAYVMTFGKFKDKRLDACGAHDLDNYAKWVRSEAVAKGKPIQGVTMEALEAIEAFLKTRDLAAK